ncbi:preprotein translocase subunit YajC [Granulicatella seriolae]|uniref:Preprotein translocase subunit YajC n=1 Tax=Granulicatella seriolae TaxID=2967226 RepID=A0ABT1WQJ4_9LACT|nr:preprotein translocase subunit YajC [Granulicatella seriolae]
MANTTLLTILISSLVFIVFIVSSLAIYYFSTRKNLKGQREHFRRLHQDLHVGQKVIFSNGFYGTVKKVGDEKVDIGISHGTIVTVSRFAISEIVDDKK